MIGRAATFAADLHARVREADLGGPAPGLLVRVGMDTGEVIAEEKGYFGATVIRAARIVDLARGGQTLASEVTRLLAEPAFAPGTAPVVFEAAGEHELKGLDGTHRLYEVAPAL